MTRGILYYTHNKCDERILLTCRRQLQRCSCFHSIPITSVSLFPIDFGKNIVMDLISSELTMFKQIVAGLEAMDTDVVYHAEHDVLYHPSHFDFIPPRDDTFYFNLNVWSVNDFDGKALYYDGMKMTSGVVANRKILIESYRNKIKWVEKEQYFSRRRIGFEPGRRESSASRKNDYAWDTFKSEHPNVDIKHDHNITRKRFNIEDYRCKNRIRDSFTVSDEIPAWGKTFGRFEEFLRGIYGEDQMCWPKEHYRGDCGREGGPDRPLQGEEDRHAGHGAS